jgi:TolB-like protein
MQLPFPCWTLPLAFLGALSTPLSGTQAPQVALAPFEVSNDTAGTVRRAADSCLAELAAGLTAKGIRVARHPSLDLKRLARAQPAPWAVLGEFKREKGRVQAELRIVAVPSGEEMRSYFNTEADPQALVALGAKVAERIAIFVKETPPPSNEP